MTKADELSEQVIHLSLELVSDRGLENHSIRNVAALANCSTTPITSRFKNKSGLIQAAQKKALELDTAFHQQLADEAVGMPISFATLTSYIRGYLYRRTQFKVARFWSEMIAKNDQGLTSKAESTRWHEMRIRFWQGMLAGSPHACHPELATLLCCYLFMEEFYAYELAGDINYQLMLTESIETLLCNTFSADTNAKRGDVIRWLNNNAVDFPYFDTQARSELANRLVELAVEAIRQKGLNALSLRTLTTKAGVSSAAIAYHFGNMSNFSNAALWHVLLYALPAQFDANKTVKRLRNIQEWTHSLQQLTRSADGDSPGGFYSDYSRLTGQACLFAGQDHQIHPLISHLRKIDGWGTHRSGNSSWPEHFSVDRGTAATFGIWLKGRSLLHEAISDQSEIPGQVFISAAEILLLD